MNNLTLCLLNTLDIFNFYLLMRIFLNKKRWGTWTIFAGFGVFYIINTVLFVYVRIPFLTLFSNLIIFPVITLLYKEKRTIRLFAAGTAFAMPLAIEVLFGVVAGVVGTDVFSQFGHFNIVQIAYKVAGQILTCAIASLCIRRKNVNEYATFPMSHWLALLLFPLASICVIIVLPTTLGSTEGHLIIVCSLLALGNIITPTLYNNLAKREKEKQLIAQRKSEKDSILKQTIILKALHKDTSKMQHDLGKNLSIIKDLVDREDLAGAQQYINNLLNADGVWERIVQTGNSAIDGILNSRIAYAKEKGIEVYIRKILLPNNLLISPYDLTIILGNLLDNAIEATQQEVGEKHILITISCNMPEIKIIVENTFTKELHFSDCKGEVLKSTKPIKKGKMHGIGLKNVREAAERYGGDLYITTKTGMVEMCVLLYAN